MPNCGLTSDYAAFSAGVTFGLFHYCSVWLLLKKTNLKQQTMNRQKMRLEGSFTFDFTAVLKLDPTAIRYHEHTAGTADLYFE